MTAKVTITEIGIEIITMKVDLGSCRKRKSRTAVRMIPVMMLLQASSTDA